MRGWDARTYEVWMDMLSSPKTNAETQIQTQKPRPQKDAKDPATKMQERVESEKSVNIGLHLTTLRYFYGSLNNPRTHPSGSGIWFSHLVHDFQILDLEEERREGRPVPKNAVFGFSFATVTFDPGVREVLKGGRNEGEDDVFAVINCGGLSARHFLPSLEAEKLFPIKGQTVVVKGQAIDAYTYVSIPGVSDDEMLYVIPRSGDTTLLGGCKQVGNWDEKVDEGLNERIMSRVKGERLAEELLTGEDGGFEVMRQQVGFRPGRKGGPRVEVEREKIGGVWVVHSYGHGSGGFQASIGCAERVVELVEGLV